MDWIGVIIASTSPITIAATVAMNDEGKAYLEALMAAFEKNIAEHIAVYGPDNHLRLTGLHETQAIDKFSYGLSDRGASVRLPVNFVKHGYKGYLEDRRPNSEADPYQIVSQLLKTINSVPVAV